MKIFKHRHFQQWVKTNKLSDASLKKAVNEILSGLHEGNLGGGLYKKRIAMRGKGKRGGYRTILAFKQDENAFFLYGYAKNQQDNITVKETETYKTLAKALLSLDEKTLTGLLKTGKLFEVK